MNLIRRVWLPAVVAALVLGPVTSAGASTAQPTAATQAVVDLTFDLTVGLLGGEYVAVFSGSDDQFVPVTFSRPTATPLPPASPLSKMHLKLTPGSTVAVSVFSDKGLDDSACITGTSTRTTTVVYLSTKTLRPSLTRPHGCAKPGTKAMITPPGKAVLAGQALRTLDSDLKTTSIAEQSYATDYNGAYIADVLSRPTKSSPSSKDPLVQQGAYLSVGDQMVVTLFTTTTADDSYCITGTRIKAHQVRYLSSVDDTPTSHRPHGCVAP